MIAYSTGRRRLLGLMLAVAIVLAANSCDVECTLPDPNDWHITEGSTR